MMGLQLSHIMIIQINITVSTGVEAKEVVRTLATLGPDAAYASAQTDDSEAAVVVP